MWGKGERLQGEKAEKSFWCVQSQQNTPSITEFENELTQGTQVKKEAVSLAVPAQEIPKGAGEAHFSGITLLWNYPGSPAGEGPIHVSCSWHNGQKVLLSRVLRKPKVVDAPEKSNPCFILGFFIVYSFKSCRKLPWEASLKNQESLLYYVLTEWSTIVSFFAIFFPQINVFSSFPHSLCIYDIFPYYFMFSKTDNFPAIFFVARFYSPTNLHLDYVFLPFLLEQMAIKAHLI